MVRAFASQSVDVGLFRWKRHNKDFTNDIHSSTANRSTEKDSVEKNTASSLVCVPGKDDKLNISKFV